METGDCCYVVVLETDGLLRAKCCVVKATVISATSKGVSYCRWQTWLPVPFTAKAENCFLSYESACRRAVYFVTNLPGPKCSIDLGRR